jgi:uncharacterized protein
VDNPVNWFEIYVQDMVRARSFYEAVFGVQLTRLEGTQFEIETGKKSVGQYGYIGLVIDTEGNIIGLHSLQ